MERRTAPIYSVVRNADRQRRGFHKLRARLKNSLCKYTPIRHNQHNIVTFSITIPFTAEALHELLLASKMRL